jgi:hypothetical protein
MPTRKYSLNSSTCPVGGLHVENRCKISRHGAARRGQKLRGHADAGLRIDGARVQIAGAHEVETSLDDGATTRFRSESAAVAAAQAARRALSV